MADLRKFDPTDDADAVADIARIEVAEAALRIIKAKRYRKANPRDQMEGFINGVMVGALGTIVHQMVPGNEAEVRATLIKYLPYYFDRALEIGGRQPLGEIN